MKKGTILVGIAVLLTTTVGTPLSAVHVKAARTGVDWSLNNGRGAYLGYGSSSDAFMVSQVGGVVGWNSNGTPRMYEQSSYRPQVSSALAQGKAAHTYIWFEVGGDTRLGDLAVQHFLSEVTTPKGSIVALDYESGASSNVIANTATIISAMTMIKNAGYTPMLYSGVTYFKNYVDVNAVVQKFGFTIWDADYPLNGAVYNPPMWYMTAQSGFRMPYIPGLAIWQFTSTYGGKSLDGNVDLTGITNNGYGQNSIANYNNTALMGTAMTTGAVNVRQYSNTYANVIGGLSANQSVNITAQISNGEPVYGNANWYQIDNGGWVSGSFLTNINAVPAAGVASARDQLQQTIITGLPYTADKYTAASYAILQQAMNDGRSIRDNAASTLAQIQAAIASIQAAIIQLKASPITPDIWQGLQDDIINALAFNSADYTQQSMAALITAIANGRNVRDNSQSPLDFQNAMQQLEQAMNNTVPQSAWNNLQASIIKALSADQDDYTSAAFANLQTQIANSRAVRDGVKSTTNDFQNAQTKLDAAIAATTVIVIPKAVSDALQAAINAGSQYTAPYYSAASFANLQTALTAAKHVISSKTASATDYQNATQQLQAAMANIERLPITIDPSVKSALTNAINAGSQYTAPYYSATSFANLQTALQNARNVQGFWASSQAQYQNATQQLQAAMNNIERLPITIDPSVKSALTSAINAGSQYTAPYYSATSFANLQTALQNARNVQGFWASSQAQYQNATQQLQAAMNNIERLPIT
ncbi:GH25 family lysozyme, partial [Periweissella ghanensis]